MTTPPNLEAISQLLKLILLGINNGFIARFHQLSSYGQPTLKQEGSLQITQPCRKDTLLLDLYYTGTHEQTYTGKGEDEGWMLAFNGPKRHFSEKVKTERDAVKLVCRAANGQGGAVDASVGYTHPNSKGG